MENENEKPTYEQLAQSYMKMAQENQQMKITIQAMQMDKMDEHLKTLLGVLDGEYSEEIKELAETHIKQILKLPEDSEKE